MSNSAQQEQLQQALKKRILVLDGAMGTMIQRRKLEEDDYRGSRFADWPSDVKGNNDLLVLTQPTIIKEIHEESNIQMATKYPRNGRNSKKIY